LGRVLDHLVLGHFGFQVVLGRVGSGIKLFSVRLFRILNCLGSEWVGWISRVGSDSATYTLQGLRERCVLNYPT
jgi:hypothetical protein